MGRPEPTGEIVFDVDEPGAAVEVHGARVIAERV
jgi:hypothetical protein